MVTRGGNGRFTRYWKHLRLGFYLLLTLAALVTGAGAQAPGRVLVLTFKGAVTPILSNYIERGIQAAEATHAEALVLQLDTPGGSADITKEISQRMIQARVPIVVYVAPARAHAGSAGTFITLAAHVAAMAPGSSIGAAAPVSGEGQELPETMLKKATNILVADIKNLAQRRGEKAVEWAARAVEEAAAATAQEALELGVIDVIADDLEDLLRHLDGFEVQIGGERRLLHTAGASVEHLPLNAFEQFMNTILNPNIAFILLTLGLNALLFELSSPGGYAAGIVGAVCLLLGLYALGVLPVNYSGLFFIGLAFVLFILDIKAPTHGALTLGGIASFVFGALMLFNSPYFRISLPLVIGVGLATGGFFFFAVAKAVAAQRAPAVTGGEGLVGQIARARTALDPEGIVFVQGERWNAVAEDGPVAAGESVEVLGRDGFRLRVRKRKPEGGEDRR
ncbi:MAG: nodulation protein NfeD [Anaerolineae bacterium]|nr:nodulation protein NfeD [Anaerolineae bacterium]